MKTKKIYFLLISILLFAFDLAMCFILNAYSLEITAIDEKILYIVTKCVVLAIFAAIIILGLFKKDNANYVVQYGATLIIQILPLAIRYLSVVEKGFLISVILTFVSILIYAAIVLGFAVLSQKTLKATKSLEGKTIPVKEDDTDE